MIKIVIIDGQEAYRDHLCVCLSTQDDFKVLGVGEDGYEAINLTVKFQPDIVLMDSNLAYIDGVKAAAIVRSRFPSTAVVIITSHVNDDHIRQAINSGVNGYFLKDSDMTHLRQVIRDVYQGGCFISPQIAARIFQFIRHESGKQAALPRSEEHKALLSVASKSELKVLSLIGEGLSTKEISEKLQLKQGTVRNYSSALLRKTGLRSRTDIALYAINHGFAGKAHSKEPPVAAPGV